MKKTSFSMLLIGAFLLISCRQPPPTNTPVHYANSCKCIFLRPGNEYLLTGIQVLDETTNSSHEAMEKWKEFSSDLRFSVDAINKKNLAEGKIIIPFFDLNGVKYFKTVYLNKQDTKDNYDKFVTEYCIKYEIVTTPQNCSIRPEFIDFFLKETDRLAKIYLHEKEEIIPPATVSVHQIKAQQNMLTKPRSQFIAAAPPQKVRIIYPNGIRLPEIEIQPTPVEIIPQRASCETFVRPGQYTVNLYQDDKVWSAQFSHRSGIVAGIHFTQK